MTNHSSLITHHSSLSVEGVLRDGLRVAAGFTELPWVREQFRSKLGLDIYPGTVNLEVRDPAGLAVLARLRNGGHPPPGSAAGSPQPDSSLITHYSSLVAVPIDPPEAGYCVGWCYAARIGAVPAAIVVPHVADYPPDKLELVAPVRVRDALGLQPGDRVTVTILPGPVAADEPAT
jgi:CTP-dependent riboflavin kinase